MILLIARTHQSGAMVASLQLPPLLNLLGENSELHPPMSQRRIQISLKMNMTLPAA
ncbi:hypothetical protein GX50_09019 [[Emmonsia] crescens]|uniref:Uncharacterized protein n=1 Tax=[Emmonsia] crescens TaxID=73230 RepID=A0A2B7XY44_9EURO|nr:hypothetical protein GX50_09019 [Emmonsia crescens]